MNKDLLSVYVSNVSLKATPKTVSDFFSFCGKITELSLREDSTGSAQEAVVVFESESAAKTALLLTNALIVDKVIQVLQYNPTQHFSPSPSQTIVNNDNNNNSIDNTNLEQNNVENNNNINNNPENTITNRDHPVPDSERTKTSVIATMLASGYNLSQEAATKARQIDEEHMISLKLKVGAESIKATANEIDNKLHITENAVALKQNISDNATVVKNVVVAQAKAVDERFQISGMFKSATDLLSQQVNSLAAKAKENETIAKGVEVMSSIGSSIKQTGDNISNTVEKQFNQISDETKSMIEEKKKEREENPSETDSLLSQQSNPSDEVQPAVEEESQI
ncbi:RNA-binding region RNP-1 domain-containing protein [Heterostelium album PN500]|uniref:RNA-binding region RNP-1 domain-containing protein n=1 Tax=Heterostelium pallidum (strain ATCC 26659 / Pp 5 / PN500) TaxID=670386 RepID=D3AWB7_HETP5|nr:RNA-binding region RNP-1 domain-containing protein [Heterostelium album PN500]EFA86590.1 RNA-binding region RNP-1 domain-containing protein [Heterostelium album PN500]|eukprot:XP_020438695.1 RNA-binding region RNP-1 domain-containing protein [Heterostelium album PN500]